MRFALSSVFVLPAVLLSAPVALPFAAGASETLSGPVEADVVRVVDGDTFVADARIWPGERITVSVRIRGVDAPEIRSRCGAEKQAARRARAILQELVRNGPVWMTNISGGKYYGRVLADVTTSDGRAVGPALIASSAARPYGGGRRTPYCG